MGYPSFGLFKFEECELRAITIEGPLSEETDDLDPNGGKLLGIDIAEYFGNDSFQQADQIVFSQLKYSTRNPTLSWTTARICEGKDNDRKKSIIGRLASSYSAYFDGFGREMVLNKLVIKLISNRPADNSLTRLIDSTKAILTIHPNGLTKHQLKDFFTQQFPNEALSLIDGIERIAEAADLPSRKLVDFVSLLDVTDCGTMSRFFQEQANIKAIRKVTLTN